MARIKVSNSSSTGREVARQDFQLNEHNYCDSIGWQRGDTEQGLWLKFHTLHGDYTVCLDPEDLDTIASVQNRDE